MSKASVTGSLIKLRDLLARGLGLAREAGAPATNKTVLDSSDWAEIAAVLGARAKAAGPNRATRRPSAGEGRSMFKGRGMDYAESRAYQPGDDLRSMHWTLLARTGKPYVKLHEEEHAGAWHGFLDIQAGMLFGTRTRTKAQEAARAVVLAAGIEAQHSPQTTIACTIWSEDGVHTRRFGRGVPAARALALWLMAQPLRVPALEPARSVRDNGAGEGAFVGWARSVRAAQPAPTRVVLASDFAWVGAPVESALWQLASQAQVVALRVRDQAEIGLPDLKDSWFADLASGRTGWMASEAPVGSQFVAAAAKSAAARERILRASGAVIADSVTTNRCADTLSSIAATWNSRMAVAKAATGAAGALAPTRA